MLFADEIVLIGKIRAEISYKLDLVREILESKDFKLCRTKTEYMGVNLVVVGKEVTNY